jgi:diguanylate cyclase (GGDEF)-like protein
MTGRLGRVRERIPPGHSTIVLDAPRPALAPGRDLYRDRPARAGVLVVDDDEGVRTILSINLALEGYVVRTASDGAEALRIAATHPPDLVILDVMLPGMDGLAVCAQLRAMPATEHVSIMMLSALNRTAEKVRALAGGADDYMTKPFAVTELLARAGSVIRRSRDMRDVNPLTGLPGNLQIERWLQHAVATREPVALMYVDIDSFKPFNDRYGFLRGDEALRALGRILTAAAARTGRARVGHVGGDDFVTICHPDDVDAISRETIERFDGSTAALYDAADRERGWIETRDRRGDTVRDPLLTVSIGVALSTGTVTDHRRLVQTATEMKHLAKSRSGSACCVDRRNDLPSGRGSDAHE